MRCAYQAYTRYNTRQIIAILLHSLHIPRHDDCQRGAGRHHRGHCQQESNIMIHVVLVDDHVVVRSGFAQLLSLEDDLNVTGQYSSAAEAGLHFCMMTSASR